MLLIHDEKYLKKTVGLSFPTPNIRNRKPEGLAHLRVFISRSSWTCFVLLFFLLRILCVLCFRLGFGSLGL